jgi:endonuclease-3 related protein
MAITAPPQFTPAKSTPVARPFPAALRNSASAFPTAAKGVISIGAAAASQEPSTTPPLHAYYNALFAAYGPQHWWPGRTRFETIVGAILVQNTAWTNVEPAIANLRRAKALTPCAIEAIPFGRLAQLVRSSGYFREKAKKLQAFVRFLRKEHQGSLNKMFRTPTAALRKQLLDVHGIGPETADAILLYAGERPVFVVDAYARRMLERHKLAERRHSYEYLRHFFESNLPADAALYNEFHALIVHTGKHYCRAKNPRCSECALHSLLPENIAASA